MNLLRYRYRSWIVPYAEGTLDARRCARLEAWLTRDPVLTAEAEAERRVVARLRAVAQSSESTPEGKNLWPGIQSRLEPRRSIVRPLILVGGLSAAATSLAWATLWGPLHHPAPLQPPPAIATNTGGPNVIVIGPLPGRRHGHAGRRPHHAGESLARRLPPPVSSSEHGAERSGTSDTAHMAHIDAPAPTEDGGDTKAPTPVPGDTARFHLATSLRPLSRVDDPGTAPPDQSETSVPEDSKAQAAENGAAGAPPTSTPEQTQSQHTAVVRNTRRHHRRHSRSAGSSKTTQGAAAGATDLGLDTATPAGDTPSRPKAAGKPVD